MCHGSASFKRYKINILYILLMYFNRKIYREVSWKMFLSWSAGSASRLWKRWLCDRFSPEGILYHMAGLVMLESRKSITLYGLMTLIFMTSILCVPSTRTVFSIYFLHSSSLTVLIIFSCNKCMYLSQWFYAVQRIAVYFTSLK